MRIYIENNGIILKKNVDQSGNLFAVKVVAEHKQIYKSTVMLEGIPSEFHRVYIEGYHENIPHRADLPVGTFNVDYNNGKIYFNPEEEGKIIVADYYSLGTELIKAERVVTTYLEGANFCVSFAEEIRQNQELRDALLKELEENPKIRIVESSEWVHEVKSDLEQSFLIDDTIFNPVTDLLTVFYNGDFLHANKYTKIGCRIILNDWEAVEGDVFSFIIYKHVVGTVEIGGDGSLMIDGSIGRHKLSQDVQDDIAFIPLHREAIKSLEEKMIAVEEAVSNLEETVTEHSESITSLTETLEDVKENGSELAKNIAKEVNEAKGECSTLKEKIDDIEEGAMVNDIVIGTEKLRKLISLDANGEVVSHIDVNGASFTELNVGVLNAGNVLEKSTDELSVIDITPEQSITQVINSIPRYLVKNIRINIKAGEYKEDYIEFNGFIGRGVIDVYLEPGVVIYGSIYITGCTTSIAIFGNDKQSELKHNSSRECAIRVWGSTYVNIDKLKISANCNSSRIGVFSYAGSHVRVNGCELNGFTKYALYSSQMGVIYNAVNSGNDNTGKSYHADGGGTIFLNGTVPMATLAGDCVAWAQIIGTATMSGTMTGSNTAPPVETKIANYGCETVKSYRGVDGWKPAGKCYTGKFDANNPSSYNYYGLFVLGNTTINKMKSDLNGKNIQTVKLTIKRNIEGGLDTNGININIYGTTNAGSGTSFPLTKTYKTNTGVIKKGQSYTVTLPNSIVADIIDGTVKSIMLYKPDQSNYAVFGTTFDLEVSYTEAVALVQDEPMTLEEPML